MKKIAILLLLGSMMACQTDSLDVRPESKVICANQNTDATKAKAIQQELDELTKNGLVGLAVHIETPKFSMNTGSGLANIEDKLAMSPCHLQHTASIYKTYLAVVILQMANEGKFNISDKISKHLDKSLLEKLPNGMELTIEDLLSHRSGLKDMKNT